MLYYIYFCEKKARDFYKVGKVSKGRRFSIYEGLQTRKAIQTSKHDHLTVSEHKYFLSRLTTMEAVTLTRS